MAYVAIALFSSTLFVSCSKDFDEPIGANQSQATQEAASLYNGEQKIWPWVIGAVVSVVISLSEGQANNVTYHENGNLAGYSCSGVGRCHIVSMTDGGGNDIGSSDALYTADFTLQDLDVVSDVRGNVYLAMDFADPDYNKFFYDNKEWKLSIPYTIDDPATLSTLGVTQPIKIQGKYSVVHDNTNRKSYIQIK